MGHAHSKRDNRLRTASAPEPAAAAASLAAGSCGGGAHGAVDEGARSRGTRSVLCWLAEASGPPSESKLSRKWSTRSTKRSKLTWRTWATRKQG